MLVLARNRDEKIYISDYNNPEGKRIEITVVEIKGDRVRLGITAPKNYVVHRQEVYDAIRAEEEAAKKGYLEEKADGG